MAYIHTYTVPTPPPPTYYLQKQKKEKRKPHFFRVSWLLVFPDW